MGCRCCVQSRHTLAADISVVVCNPANSVVFIVGGVGLDGLEAEQQGHKHQGHPGPVGTTQSNVQMRTARSMQLCINRWLF